MPDEDKKMVPIDTSGPDATIDIEEKKTSQVSLIPSRRNKKQKQRNKIQIKHLKTNEKQS